MPRRVLVVDDQQPHGPLNRGQRRLLRRQIVARPERFELPTLCFEAMQYKALSAAAGVAYEETRHLSRP